MELKELAGYDLGTQDLIFNERDSILYAVAVGADNETLDLVYERDLRALPSYACALGLWAVEAAGELGAYDRNRSLHAAQSLRMHAPMPNSGPISSRARIANIWDKGKASVVDIEVESDIFTANYSIFLPGLGGWGGERGPSASSSEPPAYDWKTSYRTLDNHATLYRLTGDLHPIHIDIDVALANGFDKPILHGLCTLGIVARKLAAACNAHPADLIELDARLAAPVMPGAKIDIAASKDNEGTVLFEATVENTAVLKAGSAKFRI